MERQYSVWHTQDTATKKITRYYVSDITQEEHARGINRDAAEFPISTYADEQRQRERAYEYCSLLNGHYEYKITSVGRKHLAEVRVRLSKAEIERQDKHELDKASMTEAERMASVVLGNVMGTPPRAVGELKKRSWFSRGKP